MCQGTIKDGRCAGQAALTHSTLARGITHDLNNMLTIIAAYASLARSAAGDAHAAAEHLEQIEIAGTRATRLVEQLMTCNSEPRLTHAHLAPLIDETLRLLRPGLPAGIDIVARIDAAAPQVMADVAQLQRVLLNLCLNARHALVERGERAAQPRRIEVRLQCLALDDDAAQRLSPVLGAATYAQISVLDNGVGMDGATRARIFEPFFTTRGRDQGSGLGLSIAQAIVRAHGGAISVESTPGAGSAFHVLLPAAAAAGGK
jgi:signal transduction histidine kinase